MNRRSHSNFNTSKNNNISMILNTDNDDTSNEYDEFGESAWLKF